MNVVVFFAFPCEIHAQPNEVGVHGRGGTTERMSFRACEEANERSPFRRDPGG